MASQIRALYDAIRTQALTPSQERLNINYIDLADPFRIGPELGARIKRLGPQQTLNAVILSPGVPTEEPLDAAKNTRKVVQPFDICFIWKRLGTDRELWDVAEQWADPLHDTLCTVGIRALSDLRLSDSKGQRVGSVDGFDVSLPNFDSEQNAALYDVGLACFVIPVEVYYRVALDFRTLI